MKQENKEIIVNLKSKDGMDILEFNFETIIELNINDCNTSELKNVFSECLKYKANGENVKFDFKVEEGYSKILFKEVFEKYFELFNNEIIKVKYE